jgi:GntR family transcriptional regulator / MocR family aminotransferase
MPKSVTALEFTLSRRSPDQSLTDWLYQELRAAILEGHLTSGTRLPASRDFAQQHSVSRGIVVTVFERLQVEGYLSSRVGSGTWVNDSVKTQAPDDTQQSHLPAYVRRTVRGYQRPKAFVGLTARPGSRPFQMGAPDLSEFPGKVWGHLAARRTRGFNSWMQTEDDGRGYAPLRQAIAQYLASSRGVRCTPEQIIIVSGVQHALDLLARLLLKPEDPVWMEDPGYFGASIAFHNVGAKIIPIPVDHHGLSVSTGRRLCASARGVYVTPAHQFPLGMTMSLERRTALLDWASHAGSFVIEDD